MRKNFILILFVVLITSLLIKGFSGEKTQIPQNSENKIILLTDKTSYSQGKSIKINIVNQSDKKAELNINCQEPGVDIFQLQGNTWSLKNTKVEAEKPCNLEIPASSQKQIDLSNWRYRLFSEVGQYQVKSTALLNNETIELNSNIFTITKPSIFSLLWNNLLYRPIYNTLISLVAYLPGHSLGLAIILITILIRFILYFPSQKALRSQKNLQKIQPKLKEIQNKYKGNQEKIALETMKLWKENKVNPFGSCLPLIIQMPILIALFYVVQGGLNPDNTFLLYSPLKNINIPNINHIFLGILDLSKSNKVVLPLIIAGLQFTQMKLSLASSNKKNKEKQKDNDKKQVDEMQMMNSMMVYFMPIMIAFFTASLPAGVGLYWGVSTLFGIVQQLIINREKDKNEPEVKVIGKKI
ncbi:MAG: Preprotein translocase subunit YidC [Candidatus Peregrinibacteria bacterium GW2011_GWA2_33_10]|nr:MAG: Preprotein translocase subunit YidC [Candidatus Peregrinibacteria bacterium GW2011_GWA2_33_10]KKP40807.1 MAG: hypothetical protein UR30_C0004G0065 [Candidatus Peregrinibacteria bacterium GW2011_GWC2_33_13]